MFLPIPNTKTKANQKGIGGCARREAGNTEGRPKGADEPSPEANRKEATPLHVPD